VQEDIYYMLSTDNGLSWGDEQRVDDDPDRSESPDIGVNGEDRFIVWSDRRYWPGPGIYFTRWEPEVLVDDEEDTPSNFDPSLSAYPNPFNPTTTIKFGIPKNGHIDLSVYNLAGQKVASLIDEDFKAGHYSIVFRPANLASGIYFYRLKFGDQSISRRMVLLK